MIIVQRRLWDTNVRLKAFEPHYAGYVKHLGWHGIAEKILSPMGLPNVGGYPSETHLKLKTRKIPLLHNIPFSVQMFLKYCTDHVSITAVQCTPFQNDWVNMN